MRCIHAMWGKDQTPPKRELKVSDPNVRDLSLAELQLAPSSVLLLQFEKAELNGECDFVCVFVLFSLTYGHGLISHGRTCSS